MKKFTENPKSSQWHPTKNNATYISDITYGSSKKYWFKCPTCDHDYQSSPNLMSKGTSNCPYCHQLNYTFCGDIDCKHCFEKSFASNERSQNWHSTKNGDLLPIDVSRASGKKYWFNCPECNHDFNKDIGSIAKGQWCSFCKGSKWKHCGDKDCSSCFERSFASCEQSQHINPIKNEGVNALLIARMSQKKLWFICPDCGHDIHLAPGKVNLAKKTWCKFCSANNWAHCGDQDCRPCFNRSFMSTEKSAYLHRTKNTNVEVWKLAKNSIISCWFTCPDCSHDFESAPSNVFGYDKRCRFCCVSWDHCGSTECEICCGRSFGGTCEKVAFWDYKKNTLDPNLIAPFSRHKAWFVCNKCNSSIEMNISHVSAGHWCGFCNNKTEKKLYDWLKNQFKNTVIVKEAKFNWLNSGKSAFDFLLEDYKILIELDGRQHFEQVQNWTGPNENQARDIEKLKRAR